MQFYALFVAYEDKRCIITIKTKKKKALIRSRSRLVFPWLYYFSSYKNKISGHGRSG